MRRANSYRRRSQIDPLEARRLLATYSIERLDGDIDDLNPNTRTWVLVHGWIADPSSMDAIADALSDSDLRGDDQILAIDWSESAGGSFDDAEAAIPDVAEFASDELASLG